MYFLHFPFLVRVSCVVTLLHCSWGSAGLINGEFSDTSGTPFAGWQTESAPLVDGPSAESGAAKFVVDDFFDEVVQLEQAFTLPNNVLKLFFDFKITGAQGGFLDPDFGAPPFDSFQASLLDPVTFLPLLSISPFDDRFFGADVNGNIAASGVNVEQTVGNDLTRVTVDVATHAGREALLDFRLLGEDDGKITTVELETVGLQFQSSKVVPEPSSVFCWVAGCVGFLCQRRSRRIHELQRSGGAIGA